MKVRLTAFLIWFLAFMFPLYVQGEGFTYSYKLVYEVLGSALIYQFVQLVLPSLAMHLIALYLAYKALRGEVRPFLAYASIAYLMIAVGQSTALIEGRLVMILSNTVLILLAGLLWLRDYLRPVSYEKSGPKWFLPLSLLAFLAPLTSAIEPTPWTWMWEKATSQPLFVIPALIMDALVGYGAVAFCFFTPLALTLAGRNGALRPITVKMTAMPGIAFSTIIIVNAVANVLSGVPEGRAFALLWNALLHVPLLVTSVYYFKK